jgi:hypothetical protein
VFGIVVVLGLGVVLRTLRQTGGRMALVVSVLLAALIVLALTTISLLGLEG